MVISPGKNRFSAVILQRLRFIGAHRQPAPVCHILEILLIIRASIGKGRADMTDFAMLTFPAFTGVFKRR
jgi:hypothetical protein